MKAAVVDASVWVSFYLPQDPNHSASDRWLAGHFRAGGIVVAPMILLAEVAGPIARQTGSPALGHKAYRELLRLHDLRLVFGDRTLGRAAAKLAADLVLRGADAVYVALAQTLNIPLVTLDGEQRERGAAAANTMSPAI